MTEKEAQSFSGDGGYETGEKPHRYYPQWEAAEKKYGRSLSITRENRGIVDILNSLKC